MSTETFSPSRYDNTVSMEDYILARRRLSITVHHQHILRTFREVRSLDTATEFHEQTMRSTYLGTIALRRSHAAGWGGLPQEYGDFENDEL